jgi:hypothetical protein
MNNELSSKLQDKFNPVTWKGFKAFEYYTHSGINLIDEVNNLDPDLVIDVGCGHNRFKGHIKNLIGFDQSPFPFVDMVCDIQDANFRPNCADVVIALGSVQFGNKELVKSQMKKIVSWVKPGGYIIMRTMKDWYGDYDYPHSNAHYIWSYEDVSEISNENNLEIFKEIHVEEIKNSSGNVLSTRLTWWWRKSGTLKKYQIDPFTCNIKER